MKKNTAGQVVIAELVSSSDGSSVTSGTTNVYVLGDGGTQSAGSGTVTHEGNGCWSYAPTQAETNYDHIAFTFVNSSAISVTVQVYTTYPQTGDNYARLGSPAGASIAADISSIKTDTGTTIPATLTTIEGKVDTVDTVADAILDDTGTSGVVVAASSKSGYSISGTITTLDALNTSLSSTHGAGSWATAAGFSTLTASDIRTAVGLASANLDTQLSTIDTVVDSILDDTGTSGVVVASASKTGYTLAAAGLDSITVETGLNGRQALSIIASAISGVLAGAATTTVTIAAAGVPATNRITATVDADGNRSAVTLAPPA